MENSNSSRTILILTVVVLLILGLALMRSLFSRTDEPSLETPVAREQIAEIKPDTFLTRHTYKEGIHTYRGALPVPTPCHGISVSGAVSDTFPPVISLYFVIEEPSPETICAQVISDAPYEVSIEAPENSAQPKAFLNGDEIYLLLGGKD